MVYSLTQAADAVGRTRQAIQAAIKKGTISARKNELGEWEIDPAELHRVYEPIAQEAVNDGQGKGAISQMQIQELEGKLKLMDELLREARARADELRQERDDWKQEAEDWKHQVKALPPGQGQEQEQRKGFFARLLGR
jgi:FtsZ-binding cell division protein ZapB